MIKNLKYTSIKKINFQKLCTSILSIVLNFYAPPTIVEGHYVFWSVGPFIRPSVRSFVPLQVKVFGQGSF